jgi:hypothetical protein
VTVKRDDLTLVAGEKRVDAVTMQVAVPLIAKVRDGGNVLTALETFRIGVGHRPRKMLR